MEAFQAGSLKFYLDEWKRITSDKEILKTVTGLPVELNEFSPNKTHRLDNSCHFSEIECNLIKKEISTLLKKGVIARSAHEPGEVISPNFLTPKSDGSLPFILNLKKLNSNISYVHFKMDTLQSVSLLSLHIATWQTLT